MLIADAIRRAIDTGLTRFDFLRGDEPYKRRWKPQHELRNLRFVIPRHGPASRAAASWNIFGAGIEQRIRARLEGHAVTSKNPRRG